MLRFVTFDTSVYRSSHGAPPRGVGSWAFVMGRVDYDRLDETDEAGRQLVWFAPGSMRYSSAKKLAAAEARSRGVKLVGVAP